MAAPALAQHTMVLDVRSASVGFDDVTGQPALKISLSPEGAEVFADFTVEHVGETVDILVSGAVVTSPRVMSPIHSDWIIVTGAFMGSELDAMAEEINRGRASVTLRGPKNKSAQ